MSLIDQSRISIPAWFFSTRELFSRPELSFRSNNTPAATTGRASSPSISRGRVTTIDYLFYGHTFILLPSPPFERCSPVFKRTHAVESLTLYNCAFLYRPCRAEMDLPAVVILWLYSAQSSGPVTFQY